MKKILREAYGLNGKGFAGMGRVGRLKAAGTKIPAEQRSEPVCEGFCKAEAERFYVFVRMSVTAADDACKHECAFHKSALGAEAAGAVNADGGLQRLRSYGDVKAVPQTEEHGSCAVEVLIPVEGMHLVFGVVHGGLPWKRIVLWKRRGKKGVSRSHVSAGHTGQSCVFPADDGKIPRG